MIHIVRVVGHTKEMNSDFDNGTLRDMLEKIKGKKLAFVVIKEPETRYEARTPSLQCQEEEQEELVMFNSPLFSSMDLTDKIIANLKKQLEKRDKDINVLMAKFEVMIRSLAKT